MENEGPTGGALLFDGAPDDGVTAIGTWRLSATRWTRLTLSQEPSPREGHAMAYDPNRGLIVLHRDSATQGGALLADTWVWSGSDSRWGVGALVAP